MKSILAKKKSLLAGLPAIAASMLTGALLTPQTDAGVAPIMETPPPAPTWKWGLSGGYLYRDVDLTEDYKSPADSIVIDDEYPDNGYPSNGFESDYSQSDDWKIDYDDFTGDLWGVSAFLVPPGFFDVMIDFSYYTGDLDGDFKNHPRGFSDESYTGRAEFDRDEYVVGLTYPWPTLDWLYARVEYFNYKMDGKWKYDDGDVEKQDYLMWGISGGLGAIYEVPIGSTGATIDFHAFAGLVYFDFKHTELASTAKTKWNDWGFLGRLGTRVSYPVHNQIDVFLGCNYEYLDTDSDGLDMSNQGLFVNLGLKGEF